MDKLKIVKGNTFDTIMEVKAYRYDGTEIPEFDLHYCTNIRIVAHCNSKLIPMTKYKVIDHKLIEIRWDDKNMAIGSYSIEVTGKLGPTDWRFYDKKPLFSIVETNAEANIPALSVIKEDYYKVEPQLLYILCPRGPKGDKGDRGETGSQGPRGPLGPAGETGPQGLQGPQGIQGPAGLDGQDGAPGRDGLDGAPGQNGQDGAPGRDGADGRDGVDGQDGLDGITPHIDPTTGNWFIGYTDTGVHAQGPAGLDGTTPTLAAVATSGNYNDLTNTPTIPTIPTNVSSFNNDAGYLTQHLSLTDYIEKSLTAGLVKNDGTIDTNTYLTLHQDLTNYIEKSQTAGLVKNDGTIDTNTYLTQHQSLSGYVQTSNTAGLLKNDGTVDTTTYAKIWTGTQVQYDALAPDYDANTIYIIS